MNASSHPPPARWLSGLAARLRDEFHGGVPVEGVAGGSLWLSIRAGGRFLWLMCPSALRAAWLDELPVPRDWLEIMERHRDSPFARELRGKILTGAVALRNEAGLLDGLCLQLSGGSRVGLRFFPRPGALWLADPAGNVSAQQGRMDGPELSDANATAEEFDLSEHGSRSRAALRELIDSKLARRLESTLRREEKKRTRRLMAQESDLARATAQLGLREEADLLAAHLHELKRGQDSVVLIDFEGRTRIIELDPRLGPSGNLQSLYRRAAKVERTVERLRGRLDQIRAEREEHSDPLRTLAACSSLEERIEIARRFEIPLAPGVSEPQRPARARSTSRLPYRSYRLRSGEELRVGRSAKDNDELLRRYSGGSDLWLHAQGVEGSHVILRGGGEASAPSIIEAAARVAAEFSKARNSKLVPVLVTERRYVRKPRKSAPGAVVAERGKTIFVEPGLPEGCERVSDGE